MAGGGGGGRGGSDGASRYTKHLAALYCSARSEWIDKWFDSSFDHFCLERSEQARQVINIVESRLGEDGFKFLTPSCLRNFANMKFYNFDIYQKLTNL